MASLAWGLLVFWTLDLTKSLRPFSLDRASPYAKIKLIKMNKSCQCDTFLKLDKDFYWLKRSSISEDAVCEEERRKKEGKRKKRVLHLLHENFHMVVTSPTICFKDETEPQGHSGNMHL